MDVEYHITVEDWTELADRLRTACAHNLPHAFEATVFKLCDRRADCVDDRRGAWLRNLVT